MNSERLERWRAFGVVVAGCAVLAALYLLAVQYNPARGTAGGSSSDVSIAVRNARVVSRVVGRKEWSLKAGVIDVYHNQGSDLDSFRAIDIRGIKEGVLYRDGKRFANFSAEEARVDQTTQALSIRGKMTLVSAKGDRLTSKLCTWRRTDDFARFPQGARATVEGHTLEAPVLRLGIRKRLVECPNGADGVWDRTPLRAAALYWDVERGRVRCPGTVSGSRNGNDFTGQDVTLDLRAHTLIANRGTLTLRIESEDELLGGRP